MMRRAALGAFFGVAMFAATRDARADDVSACVGAFEGGQKAAAQGKLLTSRDLFEVCSGPACPGPLRADCIQRREEIERLVPTASFVVRDAAGNDVEATVAVDGTAVPTLGRAIPLEPGAHTVTYTLAGGHMLEQKIVAAEGEKARVVVLHTGGVPAVTAPPAHEKAEEPRSNAVPWALVGTGAGLVLVGGALAFTAAVQWADTKQSTQAAYDFCPDDACRARVQQDYSSSKDRTVVREGVAFGMVTIGLIAGAVGVSILATSPSKSRASVTPMIGTTNGAALSGSF